MKIYIYIGVMVFLCACSHSDKMTFTPPQNEVVCNLESHIINSSLMMSIARDIKVYNDYLIVRTFSDSKYLYILDKNTGEVITGIVSQGNGANEIMDMSDQIQVDNKGNLFWFDYTKKKQYKCNIDSCINSVDNYTTTDFGLYDGNIDLALNLDGGYLLSLGDRYSESNQIKRYAIFDAQGIKKYYNGFPIIEGDTRNLNDIYLNYRASQHIALSPDHRKFAVAEIYGGILEIFHLNDSINLNSIHPLYAFKEKELQGFVDLCATKETCKCGVIYS